MPKDGPGLLGFLGDLVSETDYNLSQKLKRQADRFIRDDKGVVVGIREPKPGSQEEKDAFDNASGFLGTFVGVGAKTADLVKLKLAKQLEDKGYGRNVIWDQTGWFRSPDGKWRFEIADDTAKVALEKATAEKQAQFKDQKDAINDAIRLRRFLELPKFSKLEDATAEFRAKFGREPVGAADLLAQQHSERQLINLMSVQRQSAKPDLYESVSHPELFKAYPELRQNKIAISDNPGGAWGSYDPVFKEIEVDKRAIKAGSEKSTTLHEIQHAIQDVEKFAQGGATTRAKESNIRALKNEITKVKKELETAEKVGPQKRETFQLKTRLRDLKEELDYLAASVKFGPREAYERLAGEAEARATQARASMSAEDRLLIRPWESYDREWTELIVRHN